MSCMRHMIEHFTCYNIIPFQNVFVIFVIFVLVVWRVICQPFGIMTIWWVKCKILWFGIVSVRSCWCNVAISTPIWLSSGYPYDNVDLRRQRGSCQIHAPGWLLTRWFHMHGFQTSGICVQNVWNLILGLGGGFHGGVCTIRISGCPHLMSISFHLARKLIFYWGWTSLCAPFCWNLVLKTET